MFLDYNFKEWCIMKKVMAQKEGDSDWASTGSYSVLPRKNQGITRSLKHENNIIKVFIYQLMHKRISLKEC